MYHTNHPDNTAHAGTALLIKNTIDHYALPNYATPHIQATTVKVKTLPYDVTISAVYSPPRYNLKKHDYSEFFQSLGTKFIAGGDYNSKNTLWGSRLTTTKGRELALLMQEKNYSFLTTGSPTYWPTDLRKVPDLLDFFVTNGISSSYTDVESNLDLSSDHTPIIATISTSVVNIKKSTRLHNNKTDWNLYRSLIHDNINLNLRLKDPAELEEATHKLINILQQAAQQATPQPKPNSNKANMPVEIKLLILDKRKARNKWHRHHIPADKTIYNRLRNKLRSKLKELQTNSFNDYISKLNRYDNSLWRPVKSALKPQLSIPPIRTQSPTPGPWARSNKEKADLFAYHLAEVFTPNDDLQDQQITNYLLANLPHTDPIKLVSPQELWIAINNLNAKKTPGPDKITPRMLKEMPKKGIVMLMYLFNAVIRLSYWPKPLKYAEIILVPKPGKNLNDVTSYRPISLLSTISKLLEKLLKSRISPLLDVIPDHQFGFRQHHSTIQQCHRIIQVINKSLEDKKYCSTVFLDVRQAFDKVWHEGLLYKIKHWLPSYFKMFQSYLSDRLFRTNVSGETSEDHPIKSGVPQGSVLGPLLYLLYTSDLPTSQHTITGTFADDTVILASHEDPYIASAQLQDNLVHIQNWTKKWKIRTNESKSTHVTFTLRKRQCPPVYLNNVLIPESQSARYLGLHLDKTLNWSEHIKKKKKQIDLRLKELYWLIGRRSRLPLENKLLIYKTVIKPIWTYGIELWGCASKSSINILQRAQSKILRVITNAPWYVTNFTLHTDFNIPFISEVITDKCNKYHDRLVNHTNPLVLPLLQHPGNRRLKRRWPIDLR
jgi:hypothetical protein